MNFGAKIQTAKKFRYGQNLILLTKIGLLTQCGSVGEIKKSLVRFTQKKTERQQQNETPSDPILLSDPFRYFSK